MTSLSSVLLGSQVPTTEVLPSVASDFSLGEEACFVAAGFGLEPDEWQARVIRSWFARTDDGRWACTSSGLAVPRQNGKNACLEIFELYSMVVLGRRVLHSAHEVKTARKHFKRLASFFDPELGAPKELAAMVTELRYANGEQGIFLSNGGSMELTARSKGSGRGFTVDDLVIDEAQQYADDEQEALKPTISSAPSGMPRTILTGTPPSPKLQLSCDVFVRFRTNVLLAGDAGRIGWQEWAINEDVDLNDEAYAALVNPAYGSRLNPEIVADERNEFSEEGFYRERLGRWYESGSASVFDMSAWAGLRVSSEDAPRDGLKAFGVDVNADRTVLSVVAVRKPDDGPVHVEIVDQRSMSEGVGWALDFLANAWPTTSAVVVDGSSPASSLLNDLKDRGVRTMVTGAADMRRACAMFYDRAREGGFTHIGQPGLDEALSSAVRRFSGDAMAFSWDRKNLDCDVSALVAATLALWGVETSTRRPGRKAKLLF